MGSEASAAEFFLEMNFLTALGGSSKSSTQRGCRTRTTVAGPLYLKVLLWEFFASCHSISQVALHPARMSQTPQLCCYFPQTQMEPVKEPQDRHRYKEGLCFDICLGKMTHNLP